MTDIVDTIANKLLGDHMQLMAENKSLREQLAAMTKERDDALNAVDDCPDCKILNRGYSASQTRNIELKAQLSAMTKERDGYAEACKELARYYEVAKPVAWKFTLDGVDQVVLDEDMDAHIYKNGIPLYTSAPPTPSVPMSEVKKLVDRLRPLYADGDPILSDAADMIERLAGITKES